VRLMSIGIGLKGKEEGKHEKDYVRSISYGDSFVRLLAVYKQHFRA
jgi:hypothetical protein